VDKYNALGMYDTGIFGTDILTRVLFERGYGQLAYDLLTSEKKTSYYWMKTHGATLCGNTGAVKNRKATRCSGR
jgi:alpha-L-rhamnosidase